MSLFEKKALPFKKFNPKYKRTIPAIATKAILTSFVKNFIITVLYVLPKTICWP